MIGTFLSFFPFSCILHLKLKLQTSFALDFSLATHLGSGKFEINIVLGEVVDKL